MPAETPKIFCRSTFAFDNIVSVFRKSEMKKDSQIKNPEAKEGCAGVFFFLTGMAFMVMACLGYTIIPYGRYGYDRPFDPWQLWAAGIVLILISIRGIKSIGKNLTPKTSLKDTQAKPQK